MRVRCTGLAVAVLPAFCILVVVSLGAYSSGPEPAKTGGFGELTCRQLGCHVSFDLNEGKEKGFGDLVLAGLPAQYEAGKTYPIKLAVSHTDQRQYWGFQLTVRSKQTGARGGELKPIDGSTQLVEDKGVQYIEHTLKGIASNTFEFNWIAPAVPAGEVVFHASGNAANGDGTAEGDYIYTVAVTVAAPSR